VARSSGACLEKAIGLVDSLGLRKSTRLIDTNVRLLHTNALEIGQAPFKLCRSTTLSSLF
jgi:hypothetical protein